MSTNKITSIHPTRVCDTVIVRVDCKSVILLLFDFIPSSKNLHGFYLGITTVLLIQKCCSVKITDSLYFYFPAMAGNIIPAIATTNAIIAGVQVMECLKIISGNVSKCKAVSLPT